MSRFQIATLGTLLFLAATLQQGCKKDSEDREPSAPAAESLSDPASAGQQDATGQTTLRQVLDKWASGSHDAAVEELVRLADQSLVHGGDEIFEMSEEEFVELPAAARQEMQPRLMAASGDARALAKYAWGRAEEHMQAGRAEAAEKMLEAALQLGGYLNSSNRTWMLKLTGKAIQQGTLGKLAEFYDQAGNADKAQQMRDRLSRL